MRTTASPNLCTHNGARWWAGTIKVGDILIRIDDSNIQVFSGEQVRSAIVGPVGTPVTLYFQVCPPPTVPPPPPPSPPPPPAPELHQSRVSSSNAT